jgi:transcriptional regulator with XRE-family HTH domain
MTAGKGERLREIIEDLGLTQTAFARKIGLKAAYVTNIVNGHKELSGSVLESIAEKYAGVYNIGWLISGQGEMLLPGSGGVSRPVAVGSTGPEERIQVITLNIDSNAHELTPSQIQRLLLELEGRVRVLENAVVKNNKK